jgi:hypothetical protein
MDGVQSNCDAKVVGMGTVMSENTAAKRRSLLLLFSFQGIYPYDVR